MDDKPILVGVDESPEATHAATFAWRLANVANLECHFVHATRDVWAAVKRLTLTAAATASASPLGDLSELDRVLEASARSRVGGLLAETLPPEAAERLAIIVGRVSTGLLNAIEKLDAGLLVLGGKHHAALGRWLGGSTAHNVIRSVDVPVLVTASQPGGVSRIIVAADYSESAPLAIQHGERLARLFDAQIRVLHVVELLPTGPEYEAGMPQGEFYEVSREICQESLWPHIESEDAQRIVRQGHVAATIRSEVEDWGADLLVVGTHGQSLASRVMLGSTSEELLNDLPTSMLFVPREPTVEQN